jgi:hypothetical protein
VLKIRPASASTALGATFVVVIPITPLLVAGYGMEASVPGWHCQVCHLTVSSGW